MSKKKSGSLRVEEVPTAPRHSVTAVVFWTCFCLALILYVGFFFMTRTDGFRSYLAEYFSERLAMPVRIGSSQSDFGMNISLADFVAGDTNATALAGIKIGKAELRWSFKDLLLPGSSAIKGLKIDYGQISFAMNERGAWEPAVLGELSLLLDKWSGGRIKPPVDEPAAEPAAPAETGGEKGKKKAGLALDKMNIDLSNSRIIWWGSNHEELAYVDGLRLTVTPIALPNRTAMHYHLVADTAMVFNGVRADKLDFEILETGGQNIVLGFKADWGSAARKPPTETDEDTFQTPSAEDELKSISGALRDAMSSPE